ncbi:isopentenyl-diphosphate Delta-isomerase [Nocardioides sp.]|uniref:isopentenyl-diphosphate Delta-isomerase n=1 Tax=Nocardioides sp. TaxID=35761 RepID=UPI00286E563A|nr:isopentenyl-diphosphate Delta-isomerase [Nocardioides sp.]
MTGESVVLLDEAGRAIGTADKRRVHHADTPLHLAFSCYLFRADGSVLVTRRALDKATFPGLWTNGCCGHPAPGEDIEDAVRRRVDQELGLRIEGLRLLLPRFRYRAVLDGVVEHEMCPVFVANTFDEVRADPVEVAEAHWEPWAEFRRGVLDGTRAISPWCREQVAQLPADPLAAPAASYDDLPTAAQVGRGGERS